MKKYVLITENGIGVKLFWTNAKQKAVAMKKYWKWIKSMEVLPAGIGSGITTTKDELYQRYEGTDDY